MFWPSSGLIEFISAEACNICLANLAPRIKCSISEWGGGGEAKLDGVWISCKGRILGGQLENRFVPPIQDLDGSGGEGRSPI